MWILVATGLGLLFRRLGDIDLVLDLAISRDFERDLDRESEVEPRRNGDLFFTGDGDRMDSSLLLEGDCLLTISFW